jgi:hypothetical protein
MDPKQIFWPVLVQILLTIVGFMLMGVQKAKAVKANDVDMTKTALNNDAWPEYVMKVTNNVRNQFQVPLLFYVLCFVFYNINAVTTTVLYLAWAFVITRIIHAYIHMSSNYVPARFRVFTLGFVILVVMAIFAAEALMAA